NFEFYINTFEQHEKIINESKKIFGERMQIMRENDEMQLIIKGVEPLSNMQFDSLNKLMVKPVVLEEYVGPDTLLKPIKKVKLEKINDKQDKIEKKETNEPINFVKLFNLSGRHVNHQIVPLGQNHFAQWSLHENDFNDKQKYIKFYTIFEKGKRV